MLKPALEHISRNKDRFLQDFRTLLKQPSVSAQKIGIEDCARIVRKQMDVAGIDSRILPVENGSPVVFGQVKSKSSSKTLLIYGHYDVQPPEPLEKWVSGPFDAKMTGTKIVSRGAADSKNNVVSFIKATESFLKSSGDVPLNLKFVVEGEEEIGSPHLAVFVDDNAERLKADSVVCYDGDLAESGRAKFELGVKGLLYVELRCKKAKEDLHSSYAPLAENPAWRLVWAMSTIKGPDEKILVKGWYDDVEPFSAGQSRLMNRIQWDGKGLLREWGVKSFPRAKSVREAFRHYMTEPTCTICGFKTGYIGEGSKTVLPGSSMLKIDFRLVNSMNPRKQLKLLKEHLHKHGFDDVQVKALGLVEPSTTRPSAPIAKAAEKAAKIVFGRSPVVMPRNPASGPDYLFTKHLGMDSIWTGSGPPSAYSHAHAPNEFTTVENFMNGVRYIASIMDCYATIG
ncbi:MAG TPA: M20/M25/M40 family metallo-hydrolase [Candidatus Dormibacteraeota bacterium]|nr:M20/M25/M40 family metallo-hydrolase [Candidatus Dormibacteraeota bacterium]